MDIMDSYTKACGSQCHEQGTESDRSGKESSRGLHHRGVGQRAILGEDIA